METTNVMKTLFSLIILAALVVSGYSQTRNVLVGTNNAVVQPTNFWSADASNARSGLGLGSAATNPASAFQPSSATLSNLASNNGSALTNLQATNLVGLIPTSNIPSILLTNIGTTTIAQGGTGATNAANARANLGSTTVGDALFIATNPASALTTIGASTVGSSVFTLANPSAITFIRLNADNTASALSAADFRTALSLGSAATNPASAFQPSSLVLSNLASSNAVNLTNIRSTNVVGTLSIAQGGTGSTNASDARTALGLGTTATNNAEAFVASSSVMTNLSSSNAVNLTNLRATNIVGQIPASNISSVNLTNLSGALTISSGGTGATNAATARTNFGLGWSALTNTNATNFRTAIGLGVSNVVLFEQLFATDTVEVGSSTNTVQITTDAIEFGHSGIAATTRTNLGLGATNNAFSALSVGINITNASTASDASSAFGNQITIDSTVENSLAVGFGHSMSNFGNQAGGSVLLGGMGTMTNWGAFLFNGVPQGGTAAGSRGNSTFAVNASNGIYLNGPIILEFEQGIGTGNGLLSLGAGGSVEKVATNVSTATPAFVGWSGFAYTAFDAGTARTNIGLSWSGLTNTSAVTFQTALFGSNTNPVLVDTNGSVVSPTNFWQVAPIQTLVQDLTVIVTSQTNNATNARNLYVYSLATNVSGISNTIILPTNAATFAGDEVTVIHMGNTNTTTVIRQAGSTNNLITLNRFDEAVKFIRETGQWDFYHNISYVEAIQFSGTNASNNIAVTRTNLGLGLPALTNTNNANFQAAVFATNSTPTNSGTFNSHVAWMEVTVQTNGTNVSFRVPLYK